jgi:hypothetical protein
MFDQFLRWAACVFAVILWVLFVAVVQVRGKRWIWNAPRNTIRVTILVATFLVCFGSAMVLTALIHGIYKSNWPVLVGVPFGLVIGFQVVRRMTKHHPVLDKH